MAPDVNQPDPPDQPPRRALRGWNSFLKPRRGGGPVGAPAAPPVDILIFFAVPEESRHFAPHRAAGKGLELDTSFQAWVTGMGRRNASEGVRAAIERFKPGRVITAGFAGGLNPAHPCGAVLFDEDWDAGFAEDLAEAGARPAKFYCHRRVAITAGEKSALWKETGADAVEMESSVIRTLCRAQNIPSATVRVISDDARTDLPLDFNALMTGDDRINYLKLFGAIARHPGSIPKLLGFQRQTVEAAQKLGSVLESLIGAVRG